MRIDTRALEGTIDVVSLSTDELAARSPGAYLQRHPRVPDDTRLWAALQSASGGTWGGCVYDADRIAELIAKGMAAEEGAHVARS